MFYIEIFIYYVLAINVVTFIVYGIDKVKAASKREKSQTCLFFSERKQVRPKVKAKKGVWRIPEATLLMLAVIGGSIGAWFGMMVWRHKTKHLKFKIGVPAILFTQIALLIYIYVRF